MFPKKKCLPSLLSILEHFSVSETLVHEIHGVHGYKTAHLWTIHLCQVISYHSSPKKNTYVSSESDIKVGPQSIRLKQKGIKISCV